ncbi:Cyclin-like F-box domain containing protein [Dorcoceras hygrometricum]|uniref:Cyclin-like F-box domain containing protein n=1 Tax=Dorcoceras hygrometricum TaxID=472368 RepID=A0A2Z7DC12_9LAMI|nr:Cyclin-like F-box domain containing protein [Dorcoceras hygrometricum]
MSLFDLQDVCIAIGSLATLDLPMVVDLIGIYGLKGPYSTLTTTDWFLQALSVIPCLLLIYSCSPYWGLTPCPSGAWFVFFACCVVQDIQLVVVLA